MKCTHENKKERKIWNELGNWTKRFGQTIKTLNLVYEYILQFVTMTTVVVVCVVHIIQADRLRIDVILPLLIHISDY